MNFIKKLLLSKSFQLILFGIAFAFIYTSIHSGDMTLGYVGILIIIADAVFILVT
ncbi:MAG: hypothetical protein FWE29_01005 [Defluviitaleaceae bacterium]|nr:hypothetical protein [Defluviitaleaceae bacterium]